MTPPDPLMTAVEELERAMTAFRDIAADAATKINLLKYELSKAKSRSSVTVRIDVGQNDP